MPVAPEGEDHRRCVQRPQAPEIEIRLRPLEVELRECQLRGDERARREADEPPENGGNHAIADHLVHIAGGIYDFLGLVHSAQHIKKTEAANQHDDQGVDIIGNVMGVVGGDRRSECGKSEKDKLEYVVHSPVPFGVLSHWREEVVRIALSSQMDGESV